MKTLEFTKRILLLSGERNLNSITSLVVTVALALAMPLVVASAHSTRLDADHLSAQSTRHAVLASDPTGGKIQHIVVVMLENRSFDNMLGFLYADTGNMPTLNLPAQDRASFDGLLPAANPDVFWNPSNADFFSTPGTAADKVFASSGTTGDVPFTVPNPDPNELFANFNFQIFGTQTPAENQQPTMLGFLVDYLGPDVIGFVEWPAARSEELLALARIAVRVRIEHAGEDKRIVEIE